MKFIKTVDQLATRADNNKKGFARLNGRYLDDVYYTNELEEKYSVTKQDNMVELKHWGTTTAKVELVPNGLNEIKYLYGQSRSDADSIGTFLDHYNANSQDQTVDITDDFGTRTLVPNKVFLGYYDSKNQFHVDVNAKGSFDTEKQYLVGQGEDGVELNW